MHKLLTSFMLIVSSNTFGQTISMEEPLPNAVKIPHKALTIISNEYGNDFERYGCIGSLSKNLDAAKIDLGEGKNSGLVVKPKGMCLCGASSCVFWLFKLKDKNARLIAKINSHDFTIKQQKKSDGLFVISTWSGTAGHTAEEELHFNGNSYQAARSKTWQAH